MKHRVAEWDAVFRGPDGRDCERFVLGVHKQALAMGIMDDDMKIARIALPNIGGEVRKWYMTLDEKTQQSWRLLRRALLARYLREQESDSIIPTPAAAPPFTPSYAQIRAGSRGYMRRGRIQVIVKSETFPKSDRTLYVGSMINTTWRSIETTSRPYEAAVVCLTEAGYDYHLSLENHEYESLGVSWDSVLGGVAKLCGVTMTGSGPISSDPWPSPRGVERSVWRVTAEGVLSVVSNKDKDPPLVACCDPKHPVVFLAPRDRPSPLNATQACLVFEDIDPDEKGLIEEPIKPLHSTSTRDYEWYG